MKKTVEHPTLGSIWLTKSARARCISVRIRKERLTVTLPAFCTYAKALAFVEEKAAEIARKRAKMADGTPVFSPEKPLKTFSFEMRIVAAARNDYFLSLKNGTFTVFYPEKTDPESAVAQRIFRQALEKALTREAKRLLPGMLREEASRHGFSFGAVRISAARGRWGSCSSRRSISLSKYLLLLPETLIRYVLLHELCHTEEMNHGERFHRRLDEVTDGESAALRRQLRTFRPPEE